MSSENPIEFLRNDVAAWNAWREQHKTEERLYLIGVDLNHAQLQGAHLQNIYLNHANFQGADVRGADFAHASLINADFRGANLGKTDFNSATLSSTHFMEATFDETVFYAADLHHADFQGADMPETVLEYADVSFASFYHANLREAQLKGTTLYGTNLREADLSFADLREATLLGADLTKTNLQDAYLMGTNFTSSILEQTDFRGAVMGLTVMGDHDLRRVEGLEQVVHRGSSSLSVMTLYQSNGMLPLNFLRGTGLIEPLLSSVPTLFQTPFLHTTCFVKANSANEPFAEQLIIDLQSRGVRCWSFPDTDDIRDAIATYTESCIRFQDLYLPIFSGIPVRAVPLAVESTLEKEQREQRTILFPIFLAKDALESSLSWVAELREQSRAFDFTNWQDEKRYRHSLDVLLQKLREHEAKRMQM